MLKKSKFKTALLSLLSISIIGTTSCSSGEILSRAGQAAVNASVAFLTPIPVEQQIAIGNEVKQQVFSEFKLYTGSTELVNYVKSIGNQIVNIADRKNEIPFEFYVLDSEVVNAFAIPGGSIFITTEALKYINNEAELAAVLAHEVAHIDEGHTVETIRRALAAQGIAQGAFSDQDPALVRLVASLTLDLILKGFSRNQEFEADEVGTKMATQLSYSSSGLTGFLNTLLQLSGGSDPSRLVQFLQTHPGSQRRIDRINEIIQENNLQPANPITNESTYERITSVLPPKVSMVQ